MAKSGLQKRFLKYKKVVLILSAIILLLAIGMILTFVFMNDSDGKFYLICAEAIFIFIFGNGIYCLLSETVARKIKPKDKRVHLSKEEYDRYLKVSKANDKYAK